MALGGGGIADFQKGLKAYQSGDYATALREWTPLAEQGDAGTQFSLGFMHYNGWGVRKDYKAALKWWRLAAEQGIADAQKNLGIMYDKGQGIPQDYKAAVKWYRLAAEQGHADAQNNLGAMYGNGRGVPQDYIRAHMWSNLAAANGSPKSSGLRDFIAKRMTTADISTAQKLARECIAKNYKGC